MITREQLINLSDPRVRLAIARANIETWQQEANEAMQQIVRENLSPLRPSRPIAKDSVDETD